MRPGYFNFKLDTLLFDDPGILSRFCRQRGDVVGRGGWFLLRHVTVRCYTTGEIDQVLENLDWFQNLETVALIDEKPDPDSPTTFKSLEEELEKR